MESLGLGEDGAGLGEDGAGTEKGFGVLPRGDAVVALNVHQIHLGLFQGSPYTQTCVFTLLCSYSLPEPWLDCLTRPSSLSSA